MSFAGRAVFYLKVSRPGLWFQLIWLYLLPTARTDVLSSATFWLGLVYVTFPLNFLIYGWNDIVDREVDAKNPRKDSFFFGARGSAAQLAELPLPMILVQLPFWVAFFLISGYRSLVLLLAIVGVNALYNLPLRGLRALPPLELLNILGLLLLIPLSTLLNQVVPISGMAWVYLGLFCIQAQLIGEIMDLEPDLNAGRRTSAVLLGGSRTRILVMVIVAVEGLLVALFFREYLLAAFLLACVPWLIYDLKVLGRHAYSQRQFRLFGYALNVTGYASIVYVWLRGGLQVAG